MSLRTRLGLLVFWVASLVAVAALARAGQPRMIPLPSPIVLSGSDIGFRVEGRIGNTPAGSWVVRVNDQWVAPKFGGAGFPQPSQ
jgi:hypothetical protein